MFCNIQGTPKRPAHSWWMKELETTHTFVGYGLDPCSLTTCPKKTISQTPTQHFLGFNFRLTNLGLSKTSLRFSKCSLQSLLWTLTSSTTILRNWSVHSLNIFAMVLENVLVLFFNMNGITFHLKNRVLVITIVFKTSSSTILICQKLDYRSKAKNHEDFPSCVSTYYIKGMGKKSHPV